MNDIGQNTLQPSTSAARTLFLYTLTALVLLASAYWFWTPDNAVDTDTPAKAKQVIQLSQIIDPQKSAHLDKNELERLFAEYRNMALSEDNLKAFYESDENKFLEKKARVAHILFATRPETPMAERKALYQKAISIYQQAVSGQDFGLLAQQHSDDTLTAHKGGEIGWIVEKQLGAEFDRNVFESPQAYQISKPFQSKFGFHIVKRLSPPVDTKKPFQEVKPQLRAYLTQQIEQEKQKMMARFMPL